jgi:single-strand DNA-binding protein
MNEIEVTVRGWVGQRPKLVDTKGQTSMMTMRVGTTPRRRDKTGTWVDGDTAWFSVIAFGDLAENATRALRKGDPVLLRGKLSLRRFERDGREFFDHEILADSIGTELTFGTTLYTPTVRRSRAEDDLPSVPEDEDAAGEPELEPLEDPDSEVSILSA